MNGSRDSSINPTQTVTVGGDKININFATNYKCNKQFRYLGVSKIPRVSKIIGMDLQTKNLV